MDQGAIRKIVDRIDPRRVCELAVTLIDVPSVTGQEQAIAECIRDVLGAIGIESQMQEFEPGRFNVIGRIPGRGDGPVLLFNGHMDISFSGKEAYLPRVPGYFPKAVVEDGWIQGMGAYNMKGALASYLAACEAITAAGPDLRGEVLLAFVGGEIERHPVAGYQGATYRGGGCGTRHFVTAGGVADMAVIGEPTRMGLVAEHVGSVAVRITTRGLPAPLRKASHGTDAIRRMRPVLDIFDDFAREYQATHSYKGLPSTVHLLAIEGGWPYRCNRVPIACSVFLEFRIVPGQRPNDIRQAVAELLDLAKRKQPDVAFDVELYASSPPASTPPDSLVASRVRAAHHLIHGGPPRESVGSFYSDASHLVAYGIPTVNYGPSGRTRSGVDIWDPEIGEHVAVEDLTTCARVYAALALDVCSKRREELGLER